MSWEDDDFGQEFYKIEETSAELDSLYENAKYGAMEVFWKTIQDFTNAWNKKRKRVRVQKVRVCKGTPHERDEVISNDNLYLDMGARLFNAVKKLAKKHPRFIKVVKITNPANKFDVQYYAEPYKLVVKKQIPVEKNKK
jgi:hypothetical protein